MMEKLALEIEDNDLQSCDLLGAEADKIQHPRFLTVADMLVVLLFLALALEVRILQRVHVEYLKTEKIRNKTFQDLFIVYCFVYIS